jgi:Rieske Fe-S protein
MPPTRRPTDAVDAREVACAGCTLSSRRGFVGQLSGAALATLVPGFGTGGTATLTVSDGPGAQGHAGERTYPLPASDGVTIDRDAQVILVRYPNRVYAFALACPHENTALRWRQQDLRFQCPRHESTYRPDGTFMSGRATRNMDRFAIRRAGDTVVVDLERWFRSDEQPAEWGAAVVGV